MSKPERPLISAIYIRPTPEAVRGAVAGIRADIKASKEKYIRGTKAPKAPR